jgi:hypothetical protein
LREALAEPGGFLPQLVVRASQNLHLQRYAGRLPVVDWVWVAGVELTEET